jgi:guanylate kinase
LEHNIVHGNLYGTHRDIVTKVVNSGKICLLDIDVQGLRMALANGLLGAFRIFITPPNIDTLRKRLVDRGTESEEAIRRRLSIASKEIEIANNLKLYHYILENKDLKEFIDKSEKVIEEWYPFILKNKIAKSEQII